MLATSTYYEVVQWHTRSGYHPLVDRFQDKDKAIQYAKDRVTDDGEREAFVYKTQREMIFSSIEEM